MKEEAIYRKEGNIAVFVMPWSKENKIIVGMRAENKYPYPGRWSCLVGGRVEVGEDVEKAAYTEMGEEIGIRFEIKKVDIINHHESGLEIHLYTNKHVVDINNLKLDPYEINYAREFKFDELRAMLENGPSDFTPPFRDVLNTLEKYLCTLEVAK